MRSAGSWGCKTPTYGVTLTSIHAREEDRLDSSPLEICSLTLYHTISKHAAPAPLRSKPDVTMAGQYFGHVFAIDGVFMGGRCSLPVKAGVPEGISPAPCHLEAVLQHFWRSPHARQLR